MSDYQSVRLLKKQGRVLTIEVVEAHPDMAALTVIIDGRHPDKGMPADAVKIGAMLLLDAKGRRGDISPPSDEKSPQPEDFVAAVQVASAEVIGTDSSGDPRYRAVLDVTVTADEYANAFEIDEEWGAVAYIYGDLDDCFS